MSPSKRQSTAASSSRAYPAKRPCTRLYKKENPRSIDHACFPHIIDSILEYGGWPVQLKFRATCKGFRDRFDSQVAKHIVVRAADDSAYETRPDRRTIHFHSPDGPVRGLTDIKESQLLNIGISRRPQDYWLKSIFRHVETLDVHINISLGVRSVLGSLVTAPRLVRYIRSHHAHPVELEGSVFFTMVPAPTLILYLGMRPKPNDLTFAPHFTRMVIPEGPTERLVMLHHFRRYPPLLPQRQYYVVSTENRPLKDLVVLFTPKPHGGEAYVNREIDVARNRENFFTMLCGLAMSKLDQTRLTFVGLESIPPNDFDFPKETPFGKLKDMIALSARAQSLLRVWKPLKIEDVDATLEKIRYLTLDEYKAEIGEAQFAAEMDPSPPPPPPPAPEHRKQSKKQCL